MAQMSEFEWKARNATAVSLLNNVRHWLLGRIYDENLKTHREIVLESLVLQKRENLPQAVFYRLQGNALKERAVAVQLCEAFERASQAISEERKVEREEVVAALRNSLEAQDQVPTRKSIAVELVTRAIRSISTDSGPRRSGVVHSKPL
jgi:Ran GTPase-activating protein (RanGAP) involved in mRNA processing and transport